MPPFHVSRREFILCAGAMAVPRALLATKEDALALASHAPNLAHLSALLPAAQAWRRLRDTIGSGALGTLRWSSVHIPPLRTKNAAAWEQRYAEAVLPVLTFAPGDPPQSVTTLGAPGQEAPEVFTSEVRFQSGHTLLVQCAASNIPELSAIIRGSRASLELNGESARLIPESGTSGRTEVFSLKPAAPSAERLSNAECIETVQASAQLACRAGF